MSISGFLRAFILTLGLTFLTYASAHSEQVKSNGWTTVGHYPAKIKEISKSTGRPVKPDKFILKIVEPSLPSHTDATNSQTEEQPEAVPPSDNSPTNGKVNLNIPAQPLFSNNSPQLTLIAKAYLDAYTILQENNSCSQFFGGPRIATGVLNFLYPRLKTSVVGNNIGIIMFGPITFGTDFQTGISYRLFQQALVNLRGPFYRSAKYQSQGFFSKIGYFQANTREARVTMLLHELGHLLHDSDGRWLLPDDGDNHVQVAANTARIMDKCSEQIKSLSLRHTDK